MAARRPPNAPARVPSTSTSSVGTTSASASSNLRRNLFSQNLSRRPVASSSTAMLQFPPEEIEETHDDTDILVQDERGDMGMEQLASLAASEEEAVAKEDEEEAMGQTKIDARLIELWRGRNRGVHIDQSELKAAVYAGLRDKVSSLDEDKWMYEEETETELQS